MSGGTWEGKVRSFHSSYAGEDTYAGVLRAPRAGFPDCVFVFVFVYVKFELRKDLTLPVLYPTFGFPTRPLPYLGKHPTTGQPCNSPVSAFVSVVLFV